MPLHFTPTRVLCLLALVIGSGCNDDTNTPPAAAPVNTEPSSENKREGLLSQGSSQVKIDTSPMLTPPEDDTTMVLLGLTAPKPASWLWKPPTRTMRKANFTVPGREGSEPAELVINHFPEAPGNTLEANLARWSKQFRTIDGGTPRPIVTSHEIDTMPITLVELSGEYMGMGGHWHQANYRMFMAVVEAPAGTVFIKMLGPSRTVEANRDDYRNMVLGLKRTQ